jgi:DNA-binding transcriptional LysR family regulator
MMPTLSARLAAVAPGCSIRLLDSATGDVEMLLRDDAVDIALERPLDMPDWISTEHAFHSPFAIVAARGNKKVRAAKVKPGSKFPLDLYCALPHAIRSIDGSMHGWMDDALQKTGAKRRVVLAVPQFQGVAQAVAEGHVIAAVPVQFARVISKILDLDVYRPPIDVPVPDVRMYWHKRHDQHPAHRWLRQEVLAAARALEDL